MFSIKKHLKSALPPNLQGDPQGTPRASQGLLNGFPRASSSLAMRGLHLLKAALQKRPTISTGLVDRFDPPRTSLLMRGLTMLTTGLQRRPPAVVPPTVVERFPLPPRVRRRPLSLVTLLRLGWEKLTPRLTIR